MSLTPLQCAGQFDLYAEGCDQHIPDRAYAYRHCAGFLREECAPPTEPFVSAIVTIATECYQIGLDESLCREEGRKWRAMSRRIAALVHAEKHPSP